MFFLFCEFHITSTLVFTLFRVKKHSIKNSKSTLGGFSAIFVYIQAQEVKASPVLKLEKTNFDAEVETGVVFVKVGLFLLFLLLLLTVNPVKRYLKYVPYHLFSDRQHYFTR